MTEPEPELGYIKGNYHSPGDRGLDRPLLNTRQTYTHIVDDGLTQVTRGGIQCALDGGTFQIGMYDVTDGIAGEAARVFVEEITLPEKPKSDSSGYEFGTHTFEVGPVPLHEYVGRELAVAVRHDRVRPRGVNWPGELPKEYGWSISTGDRQAPLSETWQYELRDRGAAISASLFVEPVDSPDGKAQTVVGSTRLEDRSQTVFEAFPDLTPEKGMVVEYDEQTAADAAVAVLENGAVQIGQGSSTTDTVDVSIRDSDGTWHGPRTITLTERSTAVTLRVSGDTIATGAQANLSITAEQVDRITLHQLWTDWTVQVSNDDGATTTTDSVSDNGEFVLEWDTVQNTVTPSLTVSPPGGTYVGGTYAVEVTATGDGESDTGTALVEIDDPGTFTFSTEDGITADGTFSDGSKITIQDDQQRFGTKSTQAPHMFDRQSDGQLVNGIPEDAYADLEAGDFVPIGIDEGYLFDGRSGDMRLGDPRGESPPSPDRSGWYYAEPNETDEKDNWLSKVVGWPDPDDDPPKPRRQVYVSWLMRTNWNLHSGEPYDIDDPGGSAKVHRIWADDEANRGNGYRFSWTRMHATLTRVGGDPGDNVEPYPSWTETSWNDFERWHRLEIEIDYWDGGYTRCYVDGELIHDISILETNPEWVGSISPRLWGYNPSETGWERPGMVMELADYYVDSSVARVVLTNTERWENSDRRVTQPHFSWQEGELEFELYEGVLAEEDTIYLWVVDENGDPTRVGTLTRKAESGATSSTNTGGGVSQ